MTATHDLQVIECEQGTDAWLQARAGIVTASKMTDVLAGGQGLTRGKYMNVIVAESITGKPCPTFGGNADTERGKECEPKAIEAYTEATGRAVTKAGFGIRMGIGASPDGLVGDDGGIEAKCPRPDIQVERLRVKIIPTEYRLQMLTNMFVWGRQWWDFISWADGLPPLILRMERDEQEIARIIAGSISFNSEKEALIKKLVG